MIWLDDAKEAEEELKRLEKVESSNTYPKKNYKIEFNQEAKSDAGKPDIGLVPMQILIDIARIREYGNKKYGNPDNWKEVSWERYWSALWRHLIHCQESGDPLHVLDEESGLPSIAHAMCNMAFLAEFAAGHVKSKEENDLYKQVELLWDNSWDVEQRLMEEDE